MFGVLKKHKQGWVVSLLVDAFHAFAPEVIEKFSECAARLALQMADEITAIQQEEQRQRGNKGSAFTIQDRIFRIVVPDRLREVAIDDIEACFNAPSEALIERAV